MKKYFFLSVLFFFVFSLTKAQDGSNQMFKTKEDYYEHQPQVEKGLKNWFNYHPLEKDNTTIQLRNVLQAYLMSWITGAPHVSLVIDGKIEGAMLADKKFKYSSDLLLAMMFSKTSYLLENEGAKSTDYEANLAGINGMLTIYKKIKAQTKDKKKYRTASMEEYLEWEQKGVLEENIKKITNL